MRIYPRPKARKSIKWLIFSAQMIQKLENTIRQKRPMLALRSSYWGNFLNECIATIMEKREYLHWAHLLYFYSKIYYLSAAEQLICPLQSIVFTILSCINFCIYEPLRRSKVRQLVKLSLKFKIGLPVVSNTKFAARIFPSSPMLEIFISCHKLGPSVYKFP